MKQDSLSNIHHFKRSIFILTIYIQFDTLDLLWFCNNKVKIRTWISAWCIHKENQLIFSLLYINIINKLEITFNNSIVYTKRTCFFFLFFNYFSFVRMCLFRFPRHVATIFCIRTFKVRVFIHYFLLAQFFVSSNGSHIKKRSQYLTKVYFLLLVVVCSWALCLCYFIRFLV